MYRKTTHHGAVSRKGFAARAAIAMALASGMTLGGVALATPAAAKDKKEEAPRPEGNSKAFADAYAPMMAIVNNPAGDLAGNGVLVYHEQDSRAGAAERYAEDARLAS